MNDQNNSNGHDAATGQFVQGNPGGALRRLLTPERHKKIVNHIGDGNYLTTSARAAGMSPHTVKQWLRRGQNDHQSGHDTTFARLYRDCRRASAESETKLVATLKQAAVEGFTEKRVTKIHKAGQVIEHEETKQIAPDWRAASRLLECIAQSRFGHKRQVEFAGGVQHTHVVMTAEDKAVAKRIIERRFELVEPGESAPLARLSLLAPAEDTETSDNGQE